MQEVKKVSIMSVAKIGLLFGILVGLVLGIVVAILNAVAPDEAAALMPQSYGYAAIIILPIIYGIIYFIAGIIGSAFYNMFSRWVGGVKVEFKK